MQGNTSAEVLEAGRDGIYRLPRPSDSRSRQTLREVTYSVAAFATIEKGYPSCSRRNTRFFGGGGQGMVVKRGRADAIFLYQIEIHPDKE